MKYWLILKLFIDNFLIERKLIELLDIIEVKGYNFNKCFENYSLTPFTGSFILSTDYKDKELENRYISILTFSNTGCFGKKQLTWHMDYSIEDKTKLFIDLKKDVDTFGINKTEINISVFLLKIIINNLLLYINIYNKNLSLKYKICVK